MVNKAAWHDLKSLLDPQQVTLVAVSKVKPVEDIRRLYELGQRDFGENYVQELVDKQKELPIDIHWHFIGHLQTNKVKYIAPFVHLVHGVDSAKLLAEIDKQAKKNNRIIDVLLQVYIAEEESKFGLDEKEIIQLLDHYTESGSYNNIRICGVMGMASFSEEIQQVRAEFKHLYDVFRNLQQSYFLGKDYFKTCSMGMSGDYTVAIEEGSTMVRVGSLLFGARKPSL